MRCLYRGLRLLSAASPLAILRQRAMISYKSVPSVTILRLMTRSNSSAIAAHPWQSTCLSENNKLSIKFKKNFNYQNYTSYAYHWMRREIRRDWNLRDRWLDELLNMRERMMSRLSSLFGRRHKRVGYPKEPVHVVWRHLPKNYTDLPRTYQMVWKMEPLVVYVIIRQRITNRRRRDGRNVAKLSNNPLRSNVHDNLTPSCLFQFF